MWFLLLLGLDWLKGQLCLRLESLEHWLWWWLWPGALDLFLGAFCLFVPMRLRDKIKCAMPVPGGGHFGKNAGRVIAGRKAQAVRSSSVLRE